MSTFVLLPGAGGAAAWYWSRVVPHLERAGHAAIAVDLPADDDAAGLPEYTAIVADAIGERTDVVLVAQSLGGFTAAMTAAAVPVRALVFVNAMIPAPGETAGAWWDNTGATAARETAAAAGDYGDFDAMAYFFHDVPPAIVAEAEANAHDEADAVFATPCAFTAWPDLPTRVLAGADDRFFPPAFQQRVARERLGIEADELPGGHLMALAYPDPVAAYLLRDAE